MILASRIWKESLTLIGKAGSHCAMIQTIDPWIDLVVKINLVHGNS